MIRKLKINDTVTPDERDGGCRGKFYEICRSKVIDLIAGALFMVNTVSFNDS